MNCLTKVRQSFCIYRNCQLTVSQIFFTSIEAFTPVIEASAAVSPVKVTLRLTVVSVGSVTAKSPESSKLWAAAEEVKERANSGWSIPPYSGVTVTVMPAAGAMPLREYAML